MSEWLSLRPDGVGRPATGLVPGSGPATDASGADFTSALRDQLDRVTQVQSDADAQVQRFLTGQSDGMTEVLTAARKAQIAFSLLMEIRNKLVDAYQELQNMRV